MVQSKHPHLTAMYRNRSSAPARWLVENNLVVGNVLDYGCGHGKDSEVYGWDKYDPYFYPTQPQIKYDTIICTYVANILSLSQIFSLINKMKRLLKKDGRIFLSTRKDLPPFGKMGRGGCWQYNHNLSDHGELIHEYKSRQRWETYEIRIKNEY